MIRAFVERIRQALFPLPDDFDTMILDTYLWGNRHFPQSAQGIAMNFANFALSQPDFDLKRFLDRSLTRQELMRLGDAMDKIHAAYGVPYATERGTGKVREAIMKKRNLAKDSDVSMNLITDDRLQRLWVSFRAAAVKLMALIVGLDDESEAWPLPDRYTRAEDKGLATFPKPKLRNFTRIIQEPGTLARVRATFKSFQETLEGPEGQRLGREIRDAAGAQMQQGDDYAARDEKSKEVMRKYKELVELCFADYKEGRELKPEEIAILDRAAEEIKRMR